MELQKLIRRLQEEKSPPAVRERVAQRISQEKTPARTWRFCVAWAISIALLFGAGALWQWQVRRQTQRLAAEIAADQARVERALVVQQTREAFGYIGRALLRAAVQTENVLSKEAVPPLRNGFETVKNKVTDPI